MKVVIAIVLGIIFIIGISIFTKVTSVYNHCIIEENGIRAEWENMQNVNTSLINKIKSSGFVVSNYGATFIKTIEANVQRYANDKSLMMKWVVEAQNTAVDKEVWIKLQNTIESGYTEFELSQKSKIDRVRVYRNYIMSFPNNIIASYFKFPSEEISNIMNKIITTKETKKTFESGEMEAVNPF